MATQLHKLDQPFTKSVTVEKEGGTLSLALVRCRVE